MKSVATANRNIKNTAANALLVANIFVWYAIAFKTITNSLEQIAASDAEKLLIIGINAGAIAISALIGSFLSSNFKKRINFLYIWTSAGIIISLIPIGLGTTSINSLLVTSLIFGVYFGLGMPTTLGYFSSSVSIENRGKTSGITYLLIGLFSVLGVVLLGDFIAGFIILAVIRLLGLVFFHILRERAEIIQETARTTYRKIIFNKTFLMYFIPWCIFALVNYMTIPIIEQNFSDQKFADFIKLAPILETVVIAIVAVISGFLADNLGRKRLTMIGFIMLGVGFAPLGLFSQDIAAGYIYTIADGVAWGIFNVVFMLTVWGDLAKDHNSAKFYAIGAMPYIFAVFMRNLLGPILIDNVEKGAIFSFASIFLFVAVLPLLYAPETLPESIMKKRDLSSYVQKAMEKAQSDSEKKNSPTSSFQFSVTKNEPESNAEYEEAQKLAEKYY